MKRTWVLAIACGLMLLSLPAAAQEKLAVSIWGGSWRDLVAETVAKKFTQETGVSVEFITGGTIDRLNKAKLAKGTPESDLNFTTSHVGWLYANDDLYEQLDLGKVPNAKNLVDQAKISPFCQFISSPPDSIAETTTMWLGSKSGAASLPLISGFHKSAQLSKVTPGNRSGR